MIDAMSLNNSREENPIPRWQIHVYTEIWNDIDDANQKLFWKSLGLCLIGRVIFHFPLFSDYKDEICLLHSVGKETARVVVVFLAIQLFWQLLVFGFHWVVQA